MAAQRKKRVVMIAKDLKENEKAYVKTLPKSSFIGYGGNRKHYANYRWEAGISSKSILFVLHCQRQRVSSTALALLLLNNLFSDPSSMFSFSLLPQLLTCPNLWMKIIHSHSSESFTICYLTPHTTSNETFTPLLGNNTKI